VPVTFTNVDNVCTGTTGETDVTSFGLHARAGHRFLAANGWFAEPTLGVDATWSDIGDMQVGVASVAFSNGFAASGVLEGKFGHVAEIAGGRLETFASAGLRESFADTGAATFDGVEVDPGSPGTVWTYGGGVAYTADEGQSGYLKASGKQGSASGFSVEGGVTMAF
jgi:outer membrane autotransporter protein